MNWFVKLNSFIEILEPEFNEGPQMIGRKKNASRSLIMNTHSTNQPTNHPTSQPASVLLIHPYTYTNIDEYNIHRQKLTILQLVNGTRSVTVVHAGHRRRTNERTNEHWCIMRARALRLSIRRIIWLVRSCVGVILAFRIYA